MNQVQLPFVHHVQAGDGTDRPPRWPMLPDSACCRSHP